jgi:hypothetical protein
LPKQKAHYEASWASNPAATKAIIASLPANSIPVEEIGYAFEVFDTDGINDVVSKANQKRARRFRNATKNKGRKCHCKY